MPSFCLKSLAINLTLKVYNDPSKLYFLLNTHLHPMGLEPAGRSTNTHLLLDIMESISSLTASFQNATSLEAITSRNVFGSSSAVNKMGILFKIVVLFLQ